MWLGLPVLWLVLRARAIPLRIARARLARARRAHDHQHGRLARARDQLAAVAVVGPRRDPRLHDADLLGALGRALFGERLEPRQLVGVAPRRSAWRCCSGTSSARSRGGRSRRSGCWSRPPSGRSARSRCGAPTIDAPTLAIVFWMTLLTTLVHDRARRCPRARPLGRAARADLAAIAYNAVLIFGFSQPPGWSWRETCRRSPRDVGDADPGARPVLGAWWLHEQLHWQDGAAIVLVLVAIASVMLPRRRSRAQRA